LSLEKTKFLILDDNFHMLNIVQAVLRGFGAKDFVGITDPQEALAILRRHKIDIVIADYSIPSMDGLDFVRLVRQSADIPNPDVPIIMLTAHTERQRVVSARDAGITEFCAKPITAAELARKINAVTSVPRSFVVTPAYVGPDRRRHAAQIEHGDRRHLDIGLTDPQAHDDARRAVLTMRRERIESGEAVPEDPVAAEEETALPSPADPAAA
jgi:CheY-like chemotaxis protein